MAMLELNEDQLLTLKAVWEYFVESDDHLDALQEGLEISNEDRGFDEDGEETEDYDEAKDPVAKRVNELGSLIMNL